MTSREMLPDELVEAMESLHQYPRLIAERAYEQGRRDALAQPPAPAEGHGLVITVCPHSVDKRFSRCLMCESAAPAEGLREALEFVADWAGDCAESPGDNEFFGFTDIERGAAPP